MRMTIRRWKPRRRQQQELPQTLRIHLHLHPVHPTVVLRPVHPTVDHQVQVMTVRQAVNRQVPAKEVRNNHEW